MTQGRIRRRTFAAAAVLAAAVGTAWPVRAQPRLEKTRVGIAVPGKGELHFLPLTIADQLGYFKAEGLEVELIDGPSGIADISCGTFDQVIAAQARGQSAQSFVLQGRAPAIALGVSTRAVPNFRSMADLRGLRIGVSAQGSTSHLMANRVLAQAGLRPEEASFVSVGSALVAQSALRGGQVDALCNPDPAMTLLEQRSEVRIVSDARTLKGTERVFGGPMPAACLYAPQEYVERHPQVCQALAHATVHALKWLQTAGPRDIVKTVPEAYLLGDRALYLASFEKLRESISPDGILTIEGARTALRALSAFDAGVAAARIDLARTYTNAYARRAKERFRA
jgi:NitT/TauT family transport system substrate-binding protein